MEDQEECCKLSCALDTTPWKLLGNCEQEAPVVCYSSDSEDYEEEEFTDTEDMDVGSIDAKKAYAEGTINEPGDAKEPVEVCYWLKV